MRKLFRSIVLVICSVLLHSGCGWLYAPAGRSKPDLRESTRQVLQIESKKDLNLNGLSPGITISELKKGLSSNVLLSEGESFWQVLDSESGANLRLYTTKGESDVVTIVESDYRGTLYFGDLPLCTCLDPEAKLENLPIVSVQVGGENILITAPQGQY